MKGPETTSQAHSVFLLGAGFSYPFGFPLACELFPKVLSAKTTPFLESELERILDFFFPNRATLPSQLPCIEEFLSEMDAYLELRPAWGPKPDPTIEQVRGDLLRSLTSYLDELCIQKDFDDEGRSLVAFVERFQEGVTFITLNYDVLLEKAIHLVHGEVNRADPCKPQHVIKLHGSIDLWDITKMEPAHPELFEIHEYPKHRYARTKYVEGDAPSSDLGPAIESQKFPIIVPPTFFKHYTDPFISQQIKWGLHALSMAQDVYVIGCSINPFDRHLQALLRFANYRRTFVAEATASAPRWHVINGPGTHETTGRIRETLGIEAEAIPLGWEDWLKSITF